MRPVSSSDLRFIRRRSTAAALLLVAAAAAAAPSGCGRSELYPRAAAMHGGPTTTPHPDAGSPLPPADASPGTPPLSGPDAQRALLERWNAAVDATPSPFDFHWTGLNNFPFPTYKGGSAEAYRAFADVLIAFFQSGDNFDFLVRNHLLDAPVLVALGISTSFEGLTDDYARGKYAFAMFSDYTRQALIDIHDKVESALSR
jgi:hypothetical protein